MEGVADMPPKDRKIMLCPNASGPHLVLLKKYLEQEGAKVRMVSWFGKQTPFSVAQLIAYRLMGYRTLNINWMPFNHRYQMRLVRGLCGILGVHVIWTVHNLSPHSVQFGSREADEAAMRYMIDWAEAGIVHSARTKEELQKRYGTGLDISVVPLANYFDLVHPADPAAARRKLGFPEDKVIVLMLGPSRWNKGVRDYLEVMAQMPDKYHGVLAGGCRNEEIKELIGSCSRKHPGRFTVRLEHLSDEEVSEYFAASDVFFMPFEDITTSGSIMEALSRGKAIVTTDKGNNYMLVRNGENGYISNDTGELAARLRDIDRSRAKEMGERSLEIAEAYSWDATAESYSEVFDHVMEEGKA